MKKYNIKKGQRVIELLKKEEKKKYFCAKVDGIVRSLDYCFSEDKSVNIEFLDLKHSEACKIYETSLRFLSSLAIRTIDERIDVRYYYYISRSIYAKFISKKRDNVFSYSLISKIKERMNEIIDSDVQFKRVKWPKEKAIEMYKKQGYLDKVQVLKYRKENYIHLYEVKYKDLTYYDYLYEELVPSSGYLKLFDIKPYAPGFIISTPRADYNGLVPPFKNEMKFADALSDNSYFAEQNELDTAVAINKFLNKYSSVGLINISEERINHQFVQVTDEIVNSHQNIKLICVAGPSSSGKTSFANRLMYNLMARGKRPVRLSIDDFYIPRGQLKEGTDIESIEAIDTQLFNETISNLIIGNETYIPSYDFKTMKRTMDKKMSIDDNQIIIIEGIHALNSALTSTIPESSKYKIYISPQPQVNIDNHSPLSMSNLRLLRRIARDSKTRGSNAKETINMWSNVRKGEFNYIYPTQENADFVFDSFYFYEPCVLREIVLPLLSEISPDDKEYALASDLKQMVRYFLPMEYEFVPCNSLMREFLGGSCFKDAK